MSRQRTQRTRAAAAAAPYYTQAGLAAAAGVGRQAVHNAVARGQLAVTPALDGTPLVAAAEARRWLRERRPPGRPPKAPG